MKVFFVSIREIVTSFKKTELKHIDIPNHINNRLIVEKTSNSNKTLEWYDRKIFCVPKEILNNKKYQDYEVVGYYKDKPFFLNSKFYEKLKDYNEHLRNLVYITRKNFFEIEKEFIIKIKNENNIHKYAENIIVRNRFNIYSNNITYLPKKIIKDKYLKIIGYKKDDINYIYTNEFYKLYISNCIGVVIVIITGLGILLSVFYYKNQILTLIWLILIIINMLKMIFDIGCK